MKDWISLLRDRGVGEEYLTGKAATVTGFVTTGQERPGERLLCDALCGQLLHRSMPSRWESRPPARLAGRPQARELGHRDRRLRANPDDVDAGSVLVTAATITPTTEPDRPYVH